MNLLPPDQAPPLPQPQTPPYVDKEPHNPENAPPYANKEPHNLESALPRADKEPRNLVSYDPRLNVPRPVVSQPVSTN